MTVSLQIKGDKFYAVLNFKDNSGKRVQKWIALNLPVKGNKRRAEMMLNDLLAEYRGLDLIMPMNTLFSQHVANWIEANRPNIAVTTYNQYVHILNIHIAPYFDMRKITLDKVTAGDLEDYYTSKISEGLSPNSVIKHHAMMRTALQWAVNHRYIREKVADFSKKPERVKYKGAEPYSIEEVSMLLQATQNETIAVPILRTFINIKNNVEIRIFLRISYILYL